MNGEKATYLKILCNLLLFLSVSILVIFALPKLLVFFMPFTVAWIIACIVTPIVKLVERHLKLKRKASMVFTVTFIIAIVVGALYLIGVQCVKLMANFIADLPSLWASVQVEAQTAVQSVLQLLNKMPGGGAENVENFFVSGNEAINNLISNLSAPTISAVGNFAKRVPDMIIFTIMSILAIYFFVVERENISKKIRSVMPKGVIELWEIIKHCVINSIGGYFKAQFKIEIWIYLLIFIGLSILGIRYAILWALLIAVLDLLPVFGTGAVLWPWALLEVLNGDYVQALCLMIIWGFAQLVRQFIQPKFVGETLGMDPIATLFLLFAGYKISGVIGMIISVPLGILVVTLYKEGVFKTAEQSIYLLAGRITKFRKYDEKELNEIETYKKNSKD